GQHHVGDFGILVAELDQPAVPRIRHVADLAHADPLEVVVDRIRPADVGLVVHRPSCLRVQPVSSQPAMRCDAAAPAVTAASGVRPRIRSAAFSAIMITGALMLPPTRSGITEASTTRRSSTPRTRSAGSTTASGSVAGPIRQVPAG